MSSIAAEASNQDRPTQSEMWADFRATSEAAALADEQRVRAVSIEHERWRTVRDELGEGSPEEIQAMRNLANIIKITGVLLPLQSPDEKQ